LPRATSRGILLAFLPVDQRRKPPIISATAKQRLAGSDLILPPATRALRLHRGKS
jgi:hypothetical protein